MEFRLEQTDRNDKKNNIIPSGTEFKAENDQELEERMENWLMGNLKVKNKIIKALKINKHVYLGEVNTLENKLEMLEKKSSLRDT